MNARDYVVGKINETVTQVGSLRKASETLGIDAATLSKIRRGKYKIGKNFIKNHFPEAVSMSIKDRGDYIRSSSNQELAMFFAKLDCCPNTKSERNCNNDCYECWLKWLSKSSIKVSVRKHVDI